MCALIGFLPALWSGALKPTTRISRRRPLQATMLLRYRRDMPKSKQEALGGDLFSRVEARRSCGVGQDYG
jgi:hypothetical protein